MTQLLSIPLSVPLIRGIRRYPMAKFLVIYRDTKKHDVEAEDVEVVGDQYRFFNGRKDVGNYEIVTLIPVELVRRVEKVEKLKD
jgi:hypothetical protein